MTAMPLVIVRTATPDDAAALLELYRQMASNAPMANMAEAVAGLRDAASMPGLHVLVATLDDATVGTATLVVVPGVAHSSRPWGQIENVVVHEGHRRKGIGEALMERCNELAEEAGTYKVQLMSSYPRKGAHAFYDQIGYDQTSLGFKRYI
jgi:predicted N-acetyltransferase YhbS